MFSVVTVLPNFMLTLNTTFKRTSIQKFHARVVHVHHNKHPQQPAGRRSVLFCFAANYNLGHAKPTQAMLSLASNGVHSFVFVVYRHGVRRWGSEGPGGRKRRLAYTDVNLQPARLINKEQQDNTHRRRVALYRQFSAQQNLVFLRPNETIFAYSSFKIHKQPSRPRYSMCCSCELAVTH